MKHTFLALLAAVSLLLVAAAAAVTRPHYGGTLRVESRSTLWAIDPVDMQLLFGDAALRDHVARLLFNRLVHLDNANHAQPELAKSWQADSDFRRWQFELRSNVRLSDGSELVPKQVVASLASANPAWRVRLLGSALIIESDAPMRSLLAELALARNSIVVRSANNALLGTGPFHVREFQPGRKLTLEASDDCFEGRSFINSIELTLNRTLRDQAIDLQSGNTDVIEIAPEQIRRAMQEGQRVTASANVELVALQFLPTASVREPRIRQSISQSIDRVALQSALLQKQGDASGSLLPQWLSGYSFLFAPYNLAQARDAAGGPGYTPQITIAYDNSDALAPPLPNESPSTLAILGCGSKRWANLAPPMRLPMHASFISPFLRRMHTPRCFPSPSPFIRQRLRACLLPIRPIAMKTYSPPNRPSCRTTNLFRSFTCLKLTGWRLA